MTGLNALASSSNSPKQFTLRFTNIQPCSRHALRSSAHHTRGSRARGPGYTAADEPQQARAWNGDLSPIFHAISSTHACAPLPFCRATWSVACSTRACLQQHTWQSLQSAAWRMPCRVSPLQQHLGTRLVRQGSVCAGSSTPAWRCVDSMHAGRMPSFFATDLCLVLAAAGPQIEVSVKGGLVLLLLGLLKGVISVRHTAGDPPWQPCVCARVALAKSPQTARRAAPCADTHPHTPSVCWPLHLCGCSLCCLWAASAWLCTQPPRSLAGTAWCCGRRGPITVSSTAQHSAARTTAGTVLVRPSCQHCCPPVGKRHQWCVHADTERRHVQARNQHVCPCVCCSTIPAGSYQQQQYPPDQPLPGQGYPGQQANRQQYSHQQFGRQQQQGTRHQGEQGDLVDVFHYPRPAPQ